MPRPASHGERLPRTAIPRLGDGGLPTSSAAAAQIKTHALELGFDAVGIADVAPIEAQAHYAAWLEAGRHGEMAYLASDRHRERRADPNHVLPDVRAIVCVALCHVPRGDTQREHRLGRIARYAVGEDYHRRMATKLHALEGFVSRILPDARVLGYSDTGAILERGWAARAGLGWTGKHSGLISPRLGSWFVLGELLVDRSLEPDPPLAHEHCGSCHRCIDACPTGAIVAPYQVDARRCISYLTIELRGPIPIELRPLVGDWIFGCDVCQEACPWNRFAPPARQARLHARTLEGWSLERFLTLDDQTFAELFAGSPIRRARRGGFLRNVCVALGNRGQVAAVPALAHALAHDPEWLVRSHAAWALGEIGRTMVAGDAESHATASAHAIRCALEESHERDPEPAVCIEARAALARLGRTA
jgi:epoxyqueuosine reductase